MQIDTREGRYPRNMGQEHKGKEAGRSHKFSAANSSGVFILFISIRDIIVLADSRKDGWHFDRDSAAKMKMEMFLDGR